MTTDARARHTRWSAAWGAVLGLVAVVMVTAVLLGTAAALRANSTVDRLATQLGDARDQIDALRADNQQLLAQNVVLVRFLRKHGLQVPQVVTQPPAITFPPTPAPRDGATTSRPKAPPSRTPRPPAQGGQGHTPTPTPSATPTSILNTACALVPILCLPPLPRLQPQG